MHLIKILSGKENNRKGPGILILLFILLSAFFLILNTWLLGKYASVREDQILRELRDRASEIRREFSEVMRENALKLSVLEQKIGSLEDRQVFQVFKKSILKPQTEGLAWLDGNFKPLLWAGNVADLENLNLLWEKEKNSLFSESFIVRDRASYYLIYLRQVRPDRILVGFKLLAFIPQFQSPYLKEFQLLRSATRAGADINFWEHTADVQSLENFFLKHRDEYFSPQREERESRSLYFPLRNEKGKILATVTLNSIQLLGKKAGSFQFLKLAAYLFLILAVILSLLILFHGGLKNRKKGRLILSAASLVVLCLIRLILILISETPPVAGLRIFSPEVSSFYSPIKIFKSPADIFLTILTLAIFLRLLRKIFPLAYNSETGEPAGRFSINRCQIIKIPLISFFIAFLIFFLAYFTGKTASNTSINLTGFNFNLSSLLLFLGFFLLALATVYFLAEPAVKLAFSGAHNTLNYLLYLAGGSLFYLILALRKFPPAGMVVQVIIWFLLPLLFTRAKPGTTRYFMLLVLISGLQFYVIQVETIGKTRQLTEKVLVHQVATQKSWGEMVLRQSFSELQKKSREIAVYLQNPKDRNFARSLWDRTIISRFNWNSCLYLQTADKKVVSSFSLNLPFFPEQTDPLPYSPEPNFQEFFLEIMGREKHFLVGYQDFSQSEAQSGRLVIWISLDPELLPFYHSANPYFELLRLNTLPSLRQFPVDLIVYNPKGQIIYNTSRLVFPCPEIIRGKDSSQLQGHWVDFKHEGLRLKAYAVVLEDGNIYLFYHQPPSFLSMLTTFLKIFFLYLIFSSIYLLLHLLKKRDLLKVAHTFSARVYIAFFAATLIPLFLFIFFTQDMVQRIFSGRFVQEASSRAYFARSILDDFISFQEQTSGRTPEISQDLVFWISNTLNNDVNLFKNGHYLSSSRAEFFETGIMSMILDGETYYRLIHLNEPLVVSRRTLGTFSYQTLTISFHYRDDIYFLSLPFPLERQEISQTMRQVIEFILLSSLFLIMLIALFARTIKRMIILPIDKLIRATREVSLGRLDVRVEHKANDELKQLVDGFNQMVESLKTHEKELAEMSQKLAWTEMARKVAHEIKNPLTPIRLSAEHILKVYRDNHPEFGRILQESISYIISEVENLRRIAQDFMAIAREAGEGKEVVDLEAICQELLSPFINTLKEKISFSLSKEGKFFGVYGSSGKIKVAVRNVLINAIEAIRDRGQVTLILREKTSEVELEIKDTGIGIQPELLERIFEPYFSTKTGGTGLGLAICRKVMEEHGGSIQVESSPGQGTKVKLFFPKFTGDNNRKPAEF